MLTIAIKFQPQTTMSKQIRPKTSTFKKTPTASESKEEMDRGYERIFNETPQDSSYDWRELMANDPTENWIKADTPDAEDNEPESLPVDHQFEIFLVSCWLIPLVIP